jgi:hypothetical protein
MSQMRDVPRLKAHHRAPAFSCEQRARFSWCETITGKGGLDLTQNRNRSPQEHFPQVEHMGDAGMFEIFRAKYLIGVCLAIVAIRTDLRQ